MGIVPVKALVCIWRSVYELPAPSYCMAAGTKKRAVRL